MRRKNGTAFAVPSKLYLGEFVVFESQLIAHIYAEGEQSDGDFGHDAGILIPDIGIIASDIDDSADHNLTPVDEDRPHSLRVIKDLLGNG